MNWSHVRRRFARLSWPVVEQLASPVAQLALTPFLLHRLGPTQFGLWILALTPLIASSTLSLGRSGSLIAIVPRWRAHSLEWAVRPAVWHVLRLTTVTSLAAVFVAVLARQWLMPILPNALGQPFLYLALVIVLVAMSDAENTVSGALKGLGDFRVTALSELLGRAVQLAATFAAVTATSDANTVIVIAIAVGAMKFLIKGWVLHRCLPAPNGDARDSSHSTSRDLRQTGFWMWLQVMCGLVFYSFDRWVVGYFFGASTLAAYAICSQLAQLSHAVPAAASQPLIPWGAARAASISGPGVAKSVCRVAIAASAAACVMPAAVILFAEPLLRAWISPAFATQYSGIASGLGAVFLLLAINVPFFNLLIAWGQTRYASMLTVTAAGFFVLSCLALQPEHLGTVIGLKLGYAVIGLASVLRMFSFLREAQSPQKTTRSQQPQ